MSSDEKSLRQERFITALMSVDELWSEVFSSSLFYDLNYYDLFTRMWLQRDRALRKTELYVFMPHSSHRTAVKYVQQAIDHGFLVEEVDPSDARAKLIRIADETRRRMETFIERSIELFESENSD